MASIGFNELSAKVFASMYVHVFTADRQTNRKIDR